MKKLIISFLMTVVLLIGIPQWLNAGVRKYVKPIATGTGDGSSWANASGDLQAMIDSIPSSNGVFGEIWMAKGTYKPKYNPGGTGDPRDNSFYFKDKELKFLGGFYGTETSENQRIPGLTTILSGDIGAPNDQTDNCFHVFIFFSSGTIVFDQIQVEGGNANGGGNIEYQEMLIPRNFGGGLYLNQRNENYRTTIILKNSAFVGNSASKGSAIYEAKIGADISPNGGLYANFAVNTIFANNTADQGGATWFNPLFQWYKIEFCTFANNSGGSLYFGEIIDFRTMIIINCVFSPNNNNTSDIVLNQINKTIDVQNCVFRKGAVYPGTGNIGTGNFHFRNSSDPFGQDLILGTTDDGLQHHPDFEGVNIGYGSLEPTSTVDIKGTPRPDSYQIDAGAYETSIPAFKIWYVKPGGTGEGSSWADASGDLNHIINSASGRANDEIWVAKGIYKPNNSPIAGDNNNRNFTFHLRSGVKIYGGFSGFETSVSQRPIGQKSTLSGDIGIQGNKSDNCYHVVVSIDDSPSTLLDGFIIENGLANGTGTSLIESSFVDSKYGAGIYLAFSGLTMKNSIVTACEAYDGAAIYLQQAKQATFSELSFLYNMASNDGGAMYNFGSNIVLSKCIFNNNTSTKKGGAIYCSSNGRFDFTDIVFSKNEAENGGAIFNNRSNLKIRNSVFSENKASLGGGGINTINSSNQFLDVSFCTFYANSGGTGSTKGDAILNSNSFFGTNPAKISNSIFWGSSTQLQNSNGANMTGVNYCTVQGTTDFPGVNNKKVDPSFLNTSDPIGPDFTFGTFDDGLRISLTSPARNASHPDSTKPNVDVSNLCRKGVYDQGAYESFTTNMLFFGNNRRIDGGNVLAGTINHTDFGSGSGITRVFTIRNTGLNSISIQKIYASTLDSAKFQISGVSFPFTIPAGDSSKFSVTFTSNFAGANSSLIRVVSSDCGQPSFSFQVLGTVLPSIGEFANQTIQTGAFKVAVPSAPISQNCQISATTNLSFKGYLLADPSTGQIKVVNPNPAGTYLVTVKVNAGFVSVTKTFTLTVTKPSCSSGGFVNNANYPEGFQITESVVADFNGDGKQDIASGLFSSIEGPVSVRLGNGNGSFGSSIRSDVSSGIKTLVTADFNGDGKLDIATAGASNFVSVRLGDGSGGFSGNIEIPAFSAQRMAVGDFNKDGIPDLAVTNGNQNRVHILMGDGTGNFAVGTSVVVGLIPNYIVVSDFNKDGNPDLATSNGFGASTSILLGNGLGGFPNRTDLPNSDNSVALTVADFNQDGNPDLLTSNESSSSLSLRRGNGNGTFGPADEIPIPFNSSFTLAGDFNGDGFIDIATLSYANNTINILPGDGSGNYVSVQNSDINVPFNSNHIAQGDFNADGILDLLFSSNGNSIRMGSQSNIWVSGNSASIEKGENAPSLLKNTDFGSAFPGQQISKTFKINNWGTVPLIIDQISFSGSPDDLAAFQFDSIGLPVSIPVRDSLFFNVVFFDNGLPGFKSAVLQIHNNVCGSELFGFTIKAKLNSLAPTGPLYIEPASGTYNSAQMVSIIAGDPEATIIYTTNGSDPVEGGQNTFTYSGPFLQACNTTIKAAVYYPNGQGLSDIVTSNLIISAAKPLTPGPISGIKWGVCSSSVRTYSISPVTNATSYKWNPPANSTILSGQGTTSVVLQFAAGFSAGVLYVQASNCLGTSSAQAIALNRTFLSPVSISGPTTEICAGSTQTYSCPLVEGASGYEWSVPAGALINSGQGTNTVSITLPTPFASGLVGVKAVSDCFQSSVRAISVRSIPSTPTAITGLNAGICVGSEQTFTCTPSTTGATFYKWNVPAGAALVSGQESNTVLVAFPSGFSSGIISVQAGNACGFYAARNLNLASSPTLPGVISGQASGICSGGNKTYSIAAISGATAYHWTVPANCTITSNSGTSINVQVPNGFISGTVSVSASNACGLGRVRSLSIFGNTQTPGAITGQATNICTGGVLSYSIVAVPGASSYNWTAPAGCTIETNNGTSITLNVPNNFTSGTLSVAAVGPCGNSASRNLLLNGLPAMPGAISGQASDLCEGGTLTYSVAAVAGVFNYNWSVPDGCTYLTNDIGNIILLTIPTGFTGGNLSVVANGNCGTSAARTMVLSGNAVKPGAISGPASNLCGGGTFQYSITPVQGASYYNWSLPANCSFTNTGIAPTSNSIWVDVAPGFVSGNISVSANNGCGAGAIRTLTLNRLPATPSVITGSNANCASGSNISYSVTNISGLNYAWTVPAGSIITNGQNSNAILATWGNVAGNVSVRASNACGISGSRSLAVGLLACREAVEETVETKLSASVYPNPGTGEFNLTFSGLEDKVSVRVFNLQGKLVKVVSDVDALQPQSLDLRNEPAGLYWFHVSAKGFDQKIKVVKQ